MLSHHKFGEMGSLVKSECIQFLPEDAEHLLRGLLFQSARRLGRTPVEKLLSLLDYRFSDGFSARDRL